ncbi:TAXI family TRAP transporter solute-binding subunit [Fodinicurvata sp. EGI_FJ10296]|uniref:TAXI family TRAP transporter solute-binding subunit n=1 Tax=Fodinicurvata sp. EGI_FJ10296 TaxID=3231908 RepID=UPI00345225F0
MKKVVTTSAIALAATGMVALGSVGQANAQQQFVTIGTGGVTGVYYPAGGAICRLVNQGRDEHGLRCSAESTAGSIFNLNAIAQGELDMGVVQSDWQYHAYHGTDQFEEAGANEDLRAVFSLHPEPFTVVARADSGIEHFEDLPGKRVNVGNPGSGQRGVVEMLFELYGWTFDDLELASELPSREQAQALCDNRVDAILFTVGHPSASIQEATTTCDTNVIPVTGDIITDLIEEEPFYFEATIPGGMYDGTDEDVTTFGVGATFVSSADVPADSIYAVVSAVFENLEQFKQLHPAFSILEAESMATAGLSAPIHEGAMRYYEEAGLR